MIYQPFYTKNRKTLHNLLSVAVVIWHLKVLRNKRVLIPCQTKTPMIKLNHYVTWYPSH